VLDLFESHVGVAALGLGRRVRRFCHPGLLSVCEEDAHRRCSVVHGENGATRSANVDLLVGVERADPTPDGLGVAEGCRFLFDA
jgi:hypothetical protein